MESCPHSVSHRHKSLSVICGITEVYCQQPVAISSLTRPRPRHQLQTEATTELLADPAGRGLPDQIISLCECKISEKLEDIEDLMRNK